MAKDNKKAKVPKDKDIHLNVVGVPTKNVDIKKTHPRQNDEDYQLYRISIDTKGKQRERERKRRLSSLEPSSSKKTKTRQRPKSNNTAELSSDDSFINIPRPHKPRTPGGHKERESTPKSRRRRESVDSEICFTIPGEKGKAIRIVGSSTKPHDDDSSQDRSQQRPKRKKTESPRQVGFARLDEVYGTDPEESSIESRDSSPYKHTSPQVYKMENLSPNEAFKDPNTKRGKDGTFDKPMNKPRVNGSQNSLPLENSSKRENSHQPENQGPRGSHLSEYNRPSTSKDHANEEPEFPVSKQPDHSRSQPVNKTSGETSSAFPNTNNLSFDHEPTPGNSTSESKGKYPFYPYDKQKRSKSPLKQSQESKEDKEPYLYPKLPSIPEVRSNTEQEPPGPQAVGRPTRESSTKPTEPTARSKESNENASPVPLLPKDNTLSPTQPSSKPLKSSEEPVLNNERRVLSNPLKQKSPTDPSESALKNPNESISPYPTKVQLNDPGKLSHPTPTNNQIESTGNKPVVNNLSVSSQLQKPFPYNIQRNSLGENPTLYSTPKSNQTQIRPQNLSQSNSPMSSKIQKDNDNPVANYNVQNSPSHLGTPDTNKRELSNKPQELSPNTRARNSPPFESSINKLRNADYARDPVFQNAQDAVNNKTPIVIKRPVTSEIGVNTERPLKPRERIMQEINEELSKKSSPISHKSYQGSIKSNASSDDKDMKRKSKLSSFVSSIPKPSFKRNKSQEKKETDKNVTSEKNQPSKDENPTMTTKKVNVKDEARRPVEESAIVKKAHEPVVEAYPDWVNSPQQPQPEDRWNDVQPQSGKDGPLSGRDEPKGYSAKATSPRQLQSEDRWNDVKPLSGKESQLSGRNEPKSYSKDLAPYGIDDSPSVEIANRSYSEHPSSNRPSTGRPVSEEVNRSRVRDEEEEPFDHGQGPRQMMKGVDSDTWRPVNDLKRQQLQDDQSRGSIQDDSERAQEPDYNDYGKYKTPYAGPNVVAYPGQINEQTPFGYDSQFVADPKAELQALASLENDFDAYKRPKKDNQDPKTQSVNINPSPVSRASRNTEEALKKKLDSYPIQVMKSFSESQFFPENRNPKELSDDLNKKKPLQYLVYKTGEKADNTSPVPKENVSRSSHDAPSLDGNKVKTKPKDESPYGKSPEVQVYQGNVPDTTYSVFHPEDSDSPRRQNQKNPTKQQGPKGILIFVNKKNDTASPFDQSRPSPKAEAYLLRHKNEREPKKKNRIMSSSSGDNSASSVVRGSITGGGDKNPTIERTPSGRKITQTFPCGCIIIITSARGNQVKKEELISAFCKDGSKCEVNMAQKLAPGRSLDSTSMSWNPESPKGRRAGTAAGAGGFPDIEVIADGVVSRKPIKSRPPAPTMNGAKLTGSFKINSNKVNGVCNIYLDKKLKKYMRDNMDKIKLLLEDDK